MEEAKAIAEKWLKCGFLEKYRISGEEWIKKLTKGANVGR